MDVKYTAGAAALLVPEIGCVERGQVVSVPDDLGKQLIAQGWEQVQAPTTPKTITKENA